MKLYLLLFLPALWAQTKTSLSVGSTPITRGTNGSVEVNKSGVLGEQPTTGTGNIVRAISPSIDLSHATGAPTWNQNTTGNAATATDLASYPPLCSGGQFSQGLSAGSNNCGTPPSGGSSGTLICSNGPAPNTMTCTEDLAAPAFTGTGPDPFINFPSNTSHMPSAGDLWNNAGALTFNGFALLPSGGSAARLTNLPIILTTIGSGPATWTQATNTLNIPQSSGGGGMLFNFPMGSAFGASTTSYLSQGFVNYGSAENRVQMPIPVTGTLQKMTMWVNQVFNVQPSSGSLACTLNVNGSSSGLSISIPAGATVTTALTDGVHTAGVQANDLLDLQCVNSATESSLIPVGVNVVVQ